MLCIELIMAMTLPSERSFLLIHLHIYIYTHSTHHTYHTYSIPYIPYILIHIHTMQLDTIHRNTLYTTHNVDTILLYTSYTIHFHTCTHLLIHTVIFIQTRIQAFIHRLKHITSMITYTLHPYKIHTLFSSSTFMWSQAPGTNPESSVNRYIDIYKVF